ncbi:MAG: nucleotidyltransferase domain-containing protein [Mariniblastus sp.]
MDLVPSKKFIETLIENEPNFNPLFITISGSHIYGFSSPDSDVDLRGCHRLPVESVVGLSLPNETIDRTSIEDGVEVDVVSHDVGKYFRLLVKNNGLILEQIFSPLVVMGQEFLDELKPIAQRCITRFHFHHYRGFYATKRKDLERQNVKQAKSLLYAYRVLCTGTHLMKTGRMETDIRMLHGDMGLDFIPDLIAAKKQEKIELADLDWDFHASELDRLEAAMERAFESSDLTEQRDTEAVNELLVRLRLG